MIRTFHSVGQGALYSENFKNFTFVYDCGSYKNKELIESEIRNSFDSKENIDAIFISHFHEDHINGLEYLLKNYKIKYLFLPFLTEFEKIFLVIENSIIGTRNTYLEGIILDPEQTINNDVTQVIRIEPKSDNNDDKELLLIDNVDFPSKIKSGTKLAIGLSNWLLIPFHFRRDEKTKQFQALIKAAGLKIESIVDFKAILEDSSKFSMLEQCYKDVKGTLNSNSLVLYSGPNESPMHSIYVSYTLPFKPLYPFYPLEAGCIYFGDYDASGNIKWKDLESSYSGYWNKIGCVQIPHHGSRHNYNTNINKKNPVLSILSCGETNHFRHPHGSVVKKILKNDGYPMIVTEKPHTRISQKIEII